MIGKRLKIARTSAGLSLRNLEARIKSLVTAQALGKYERDEMMPSSAVLIELARALGVTESYLLSQGDLQLEGVEFRKNKITSRKEEAQVEATVLDHVERYLEIEEILGVNSAEWSAPDGTPFRASDGDGAEYAAFGVRTAWNLGIDPALHLSEFLEEKGIKILCLRLPESLAGLTCGVVRTNRPKVPVIVINETTTGERQRFTLAHELGHMLLRVADGVDPEPIANRFASAFLMPKASFLQEIGQHRSRLTMGELFELKSLFGVSVQAITYRCKDLGIITPTAYRELFAEFKRLGWRDPPYDEPQPVPKEKPERFKRLCYRAMAEEAISESKAAELLGVRVRELQQSVYEPPVKQRQ